MSIETLKEDLKLNLAEVAALDPAVDTPTLVAHLKNTLWPTLEAIVDELAEVDDCVADLVSGEDILQEDTATVFAAVLAGAATVAAALKVRITREAEPQLYKVLTELEGNIAAANEIMEDIVVGADADDEEDDGEEDDADDKETEQ